MGCALLGEKSLDSIYALYIPIRLAPGCTSYGYS